MGQGRIRFDITDNGADVLRSLTIQATVATLLDEEERRAQFALDIQGDEK